MTLRATCVIQRLSGWGVMPSMWSDREAMSMKIYTQMQFTLCRDHSKSHSSLILGNAGKSDSVARMMNWTD